MRSESGQGGAGDQTQDPRPAPSQGVGELVSAGSEPARSPKKYGTTISGEELLLRIYAGPGAVDALLANVHPNRIWTENSRFSAITSTSGATASRSHWAKPIDKFLDPVSATIARAEDRFPRTRESWSFKLNRGVGIVIFSWFGYGQGRSLMRRAFAPLLVNTDFRSVPVRPKPAARSLWPQIQSRLSAS